MATQLAADIHTALESFHDPIIKVLYEPDRRMPWPGQNSRQVWPQADISGELVSGEIFIVEVDDHADPGRSLAKYWPLLHAIAKQELEYPPIRFFEISSPDGTFGIGYELLARFIGDRFKEMYPRVFTYNYTSLRGKDPKGLAGEVLVFLKSSAGK